MQKFIWWLPRVMGITIVLVMLISGIVDCIRFPYGYLDYLLLTLFLALFIGLLVFLAWKKPRVGGIILLFLGVITAIAALSDYYGPDWRGFSFAGLPFLIMGGLFSWEGWVHKKESKNKNNKLPL